MNLKELYKDKNHAILSEVLRVLESSRIWNGQGWTYHPIHPVKYEALIGKVRTELDRVIDQYK